MEQLAALRLPVALTGITLLLITLFLQYGNFTGGYTLPLVSLFLFKTAGFICSVLLLMQGIDANNPLIRKFCSGDDSKSCNAILSSKAAKITSYLTWSEVGFFYFAGTWIVLLFAGKDAAVLRVLAFLNLLSLPYTFFSIYYQWKIAKQWCVFCCTVQALLWLEFFSFLPFLLQGHGTLTTSGFVTLAAGLLTPVLVWMLIKPGLMELTPTAPLKRQLSKFKYNNELFDALLKKERFYQLPDQEWSLTIGNKEAKNVIVMITNPHCKYCIRAHGLLTELLEARTDLQARIVFTDVAERNHEHGYSVIRHIMALNDREGSNKAKEALALWHTGSKKYLEWIDIYPVAVDEIPIEKATKQADWCIQNQLLATPDFLVNGYRLPQLYDINDLKYLLE